MSHTTREQTINVLSIECSCDAVFLAAFSNV